MLLILCLNKQLCGSRSGGPGDDCRDRGLCYRLSGCHGDETVGSYIPIALLQGTAVIYPTAGCHGNQLWMRRLIQAPFSPQLCDWRKSDSNERLLTFCRLADHIAGRLKGLFILFAGNLVQPFADLLRQTNSSAALTRTGESWFNIYCSAVSLLNSAFFCSVAGGCLYLH